MASSKTSCMLLATQLLIIVTLSATFELPFLGSCTIDDEKCHRMYMEKFLKMYGHGIPELEVPSLEPMNLGNITINGNNNENFNLKIFMTNVELHKYTELKTLSIKGYTKDDTKPMTITIKVLSPELIMRTHCSLKGKLLLFNVKGEADLEVNMKNATTIFTTRCEPYKKDGRTYYRVVSFKPKLDIASLKSVLKNSTLFGGDPVFSDTFSETINDNWMVLRDEIQPHLEAANTRILTDILNKILATMPYDRFFKAE